MGKTFDPSVVPVYPKVRLSLVRGQVTVDDEPVTVPPGMTPQEAGVQVVAARAAAREGAIQAIQAVASDEAGNTWRMVIDADGRVWPLTESGASASTDGSTSRNGQKRTGVRVAVLGTAVVLVGGGIAGIVVAHHGEAPAPHAAVTRTVTPSATPTELPVAAPVGWSPQAAWSSAAVASVDASQQTASPVAVGGRSIYAVTTHGNGDLALSALSARTGAPVWSKDLAGSSVTTGPTLGRVAGVSVVMVATDTDVSAWSMTGQRLGDWPVPASGTDTTVLLTPAGPIIPRSQTTVSIVGLGGKLVTRALPPGGHAVAILPKDTLLATDTGGHAWKVTSPTVAGNPITLPAPKGWTGGTTVAVTETTLIQQWTPAKATSTGTVVLRATALNGLRAGWTTGSIDTQNAASPLLMSPSGTVGVLGSSVVDLRTGGLHSLPAGWTTQLAGDQVIWCTNADQQTVAATTTGVPLGGASTGTTSNLNNANGSTDPVIPAGVVGTSALVIGSADDTPRLYLLPSTTATGSATASTPSSVPSTTVAPAPSTPAKKLTTKTTKKPASSKKTSAKTSTAGGK
ncbi:hypothetical protein [Allobranchiibius huperziae]|uniref:Outer membrane protein assembly factor BamB n=1 Tax=Allobranchiibius huperziae TaxID=1874116 RepID=A0A853DP39_9MICO|nr:hypothetical protein [Allobranchiibius huperziae]NYJ76531.1 hypothetical protein [Allobranchiibius huperziae]